MQSANVSVISSSNDLRKLRVDFYDSGVGDTIVVTFPSGGLGLVDAHPSPNAVRPTIQDIVAGKKLHFVCLTHPHADHGEDLVPVLETHPEIEGFWHTTSDVPAFIYGVQEAPGFPSPVQEFAKEINRGWANFLIDLFGAVAEKNIPRHVLRSDLEPMTIDGVDVWCLAPDEQVQNRFFDTYLQRLDDPTRKLPDANLLSAVLVLRFGQSIVLLGADALKENWEAAVRHYHRRKLPKAQVIKVPHHGARNAMGLQRGATSYLDVCSFTPRAKSVLFAGDTSHPDPDVFGKLRARTEVLCLSNGLKPATANTNPLGLTIPGAHAVYPAPVCNPVISIELDQSGAVSVIAGRCQGVCR